MFVRNATQLQIWRIFAYLEDPKVINALLIASELRLRMPLKEKKLQNDGIKRQFLPLLWNFQRILVACSSS